MPQIKRFKNTSEKLVIPKRRPRRSNNLIDSECFAVIFFFKKQAI